jgi:hypothetical protein
MAIWSAGISDGAWPHPAISTASHPGPLAFIRATVSGNNRSDD